MKVFLGGTCNGSKWREELIPMLKINYFNPVVDDWKPEDQKRELEERENADLLLYVITPLMKGVYSIAEVTDDSNKRSKDTILYVLEEDRNEKGETIKWDKAQRKSLQAVEDLVEDNGSVVLYDMESIAEFLNNIQYVRSYHRGR